MPSTSDDTKIVLARLEFSVGSQPLAELYVRPGYQSGGVPIRTRDEWSPSRNSLKRHQLWRIAHEP